MTLRVMEMHLSNMESTPHFNFRDVLWAPARALSAKQILVMTLFLLMGLGVYDLFTYLAYAVNGESVSRAFSVYGFFPFERFVFDSWSAQLLFATGIALSVLSVMLGFLGVGAINIEAVRGNRFFSAKQAIKFAFGRFTQVFFAELSIVMFVGFIILLFFLLGLVSRIPVIGEWIYILLFAIPNFIIAIISIFIIFVFSLTVLLLPAVAAAERRGETFTAILETFSTIILQPFRWAGYTVYSIVAAKACSFVYAYFAYRAVQLLTWSAALGGGVKIRRLVESGLANLPVKSDVCRETCNLLPEVQFGFDLYAIAGVPSDSMAVHAMAFMIFLVFASVIGYMFAIIAAGQARGYVALRYIKDGYNVADEDSLFFTPEPVNEEVAGEQWEAAPDNEND